MRRLVGPMLRLARASIAPSPATPADRVLPRYLAWRLRILAMVIVLSLSTAGIDTVARTRGGPEPTLTLVLHLAPGAEPARQSAFGDLADRIWLLSAYAMPASSMLAAAFWARPRASRSILAAGWAASFLVPLAIALTPWGWWEADDAAPEARGIARIEEGVAWAFYYFAVLSPAVLALVPGVMRGCIRVKSLLPGAMLPGWLLVIAAPFNGLVALAAFVSLAQVAPSRLLVAGMILWLASPLTYLTRGGVFTRPIATDDDLRRAWRVQAVARALAVGAAGCLIAHVVTFEAFGFRLVGLDPGTSLLRPWQVVRYLLDFSGRALFVTVLAADLLLRATIAAWRHQRAFEDGPASAELDRAMERLDGATAAG